MSKTSGAKTKEAIATAVEDAGITMDDIDGLITCGPDDTRADGAGLRPEEVDIFNPYDGYITFTQNWLEAFRWHGVGWSEAHAFYGSDIRVEGRHPFMSSGGNNGTGRNRATHYTDCIEQIRTYAGDIDCGPFGPLGPRQVTVKAETGVAGYGDMMCFGISAG